MTTTTTDPTTPAPELTAPPMLLLDKHKLQVAIGEFVYQRFQCGQERALAEAEGFMRHIPDSAYVANEYAAAERPAEGDTVCPDCQARRSETDTPCFVHRSATMPSGSVMISAEDARHAMNAIEELWSEGIGGYTRLHKRLSRVAAAERPAEGMVDTITIDRMEAAKVAAMFDPGHEDHPRPGPALRMWGLLNAALREATALAASSAEPDAAPEQGEGK